MKKNLYMFMVLFVGLLSTGCEDLIEIDLNSADPRIVIEADLDNLDDWQVIYVSRTVPFDDDRQREIVTDANVDVQAVQGNNSRTYPFRYSEMHEAYINTSFQVNGQTQYTLHVMIDGELYQSTESMAPYVEVDSMGIMKERIFEDDYYFATFKFQDPAETSNYYKYNVSVDGGLMKFYAVFNDKFNDGLYITHQIGSTDNDIALGSRVIVKRQLISPSVYRYWNEIQSINPGSAAPANPTSNISNGALGYFSISNVQEYTFDFTTFEAEEE